MRRRRGTRWRNIAITLIDAAVRTAEVVAENLLKSPVRRDPGAVHAAGEIADRIEGRAPQSIQISDLAADLHSRSGQELEFSSTLAEVGRIP